MIPHLRLRHCARGVIFIASPSNGPVVYLFNNSTGRDLLVVRDVEFFIIDNTPLYAAPCGSFQGHNGTLGGTVSTVVTGETAMPGQLYADDTATPPTPDFFIVQSYGGTVPWVHDYPLAVLQPGWSFFVSLPGSTGLRVNAAFYWQRANAEDIDGSLEDLALKLAGG